MSSMTSQFQELGQTTSDVSVAKPSVRSLSIQLTVIALIVFTIDSILGDALFGNVASKIGLPQQQSWFTELTLGGVAACTGLACSLRSCRRSKSIRKSRTGVAGLSPALVNQANAAESVKAQTLKRGRAALEQAVKDGCLGDIWKIVRKLEAAGLRPDIVMCNMIMRSFIKKADFAGAEQWLSQMKAKGPEPTTCTYNTIMVAYKDKPDSCKALLDQMSQHGAQPNAVSYATAISAYASCGDEPMAEALMLRLKSEGVVPDAVCYNALIHACSIRGSSAKVSSWIHEMEEQNIQPSVTTFTAAIDACAKVGDLAQAEHWMERMLNLGLLPNVVSYSALMDACAKAGQPERTTHWYNMMVQVGVTPNSHSFNAAIHGCARLADTAGAVQWLERAEAADCRDSVLYSSVIDACGKANDTDRAWDVFNRMLSRGIRPHVVCYAALARPFAYRGDFQRVEEIAALMKSAGVKSNEYFLYAQLLSYANARPKQVERAESAFLDAISAGTKVNDHVCSALARAVGQTRASELRSGMSKWSNLQSICTNAAPNCSHELKREPTPPWRRSGA